MSAPRDFLAFQDSSDPPKSWIEFDCSVCGLPSGFHLVGSPDICSECDLIGRLPEPEQERLRKLVGGMDAKKARHMIGRILGRGVLQKHMST